MRRLSALISRPILITQPGGLLTPSYMETSSIGMSCLHHDQTMGFARSYNQEIVRGEHAGRGSENHD